MTLRKRIADWISGGALSLAKSNVLWWSDHMVGEIYGPMIDEKNRQIIDLQARVNRIAAQETPGANATVRRMARIARGEE